jgi:RNA polymerase sigma-70 factor (ECF subfamily)
MADSRFVSAQESNTVTDAALVSRLRRRDNAAYDELLNRYGDALYGYIYHSTLDAQQSEALLGAAFMRVVEEIDSYAASRPLLVWLYRIVHTVLRDRFSVAPHKARPPLAAAGGLDHLSLEERQVVMLRCVADMSLPEVGYVLAKSNRAVEQLEFQALSSMNALLR